MRGRAHRSLLLPALGLATALALTACSGSDEPDTPEAQGSPSRSAAPVDAFTSLAPPADTRVGSVDPLLSSRAFEKARGLLALTLAEAGSLTGSGTDALVTQLQVPNDSLSVTELLTPRPTAEALGFRPLFARTVSLAKNPVEVVRSSYRGEEVRGQGGEAGVRITWNGAVRYRVSVGGKDREVAYALTVAYVFGPVPNEVGGLQLVQVVPGTFHAAPVVGSCLTKGVLLPAAGSPTPADYGTGPWAPADQGPACPV